MNINKTLLGTLKWWVKFHEENAYHEKLYEEATVEGPFCHIIFNGNH